MIRSRAHRTRALLLGLSLPFLLHCSAMSLANLPKPEGERFFEAGNLARARDAFERDLVGSPSGRELERTLYRLAQIYAAPGPTFEPTLSLARIDWLLREFPHTRYRTEAGIVRRLAAQHLALVERVETARAQVAAFEGRVRACRVTVVEREEERAMLLQLGEEEIASRRACEQTLAALRRRMIERDEEIGRLNEAVAALERLRRIDTEIDPGSR